VAVAPYLSAHDLSVLIDFLLFAATLACVAIFHRHALGAALIGLCVITMKKLLGTGFVEGAGLAGLFAHFAHEWVLIANLFLLLVGFALLARHFEASRIPDWMPAALPDDWTGGLVLLGLVFVISSFLDNIAAALIGATVARHVFKGGVRVGYLAAIVAASNAGGAGSVIGDTTTTMLWIAGVSPLSVLHAYVAAVCALLCRHPRIAWQRNADRQRAATRPPIHSPRRGCHRFDVIAANVGAHLFAIFSTNCLTRLAVAAALVLLSPVRGQIGRSFRAARGALFLLIRHRDAGQILAVAQLGDSAWARLRLGRVRQYSVDRARHKAGQL
jgi:Na+/H+ antiporter NhaD/arsenite permease-like protein